MNATAELAVEVADFHFNKKSATPPPNPKVNPKFTVCCTKCNFQHTRGISAPNEVEAVIEAAIVHFQTGCQGQLLSQEQQKAITLIEFPAVPYDWEEVMVIAETKDGLGLQRVAAAIELDPTNNEMQVTQYYDHFLIKYDNHYFRYSFDLRYPDTNRF